MSLRPCLLLLALVAPLPAEAQSAVHNLLGAHPGDEFGRSVAFVGDVDGDGLDDFAVGSPFDDTGGNQAGSVRVYSGADASLVYEVLGAVDSQLGHDVVSAGDMNGDGVPDFAMSEIYADPNGLESGSVYVHSGADGSRLYAFHGDSFRDFFGQALAGGIDVDGDGYEDLIVGSPQDAADPRAVNTRQGSITVLSGQDGSVIATIYGDADLHLLGVAVEALGDVNGHGFGDFAAGGRDPASSSGYVRLYAGPFVTQILEIPSPSSVPGFGVRLTRVGDIDGDGFDDLLAGSPGATDPTRSFEGAAYAFSGTNGSLLFALYGNPVGEPFAWFGVAVEGLGDIDSDGVPDFAVGASDDLDPLQGFASFTAFSGADGAVLYEVFGGGTFGAIVDGSGDVNGDGISDLVLGDGSVDINGTNSGLARVVLGRVPIGEVFCELLANSTGRVATLEALGTNSVSANHLTLHARSVPAGQNGLFVYSLDEAAMPLGNGILCLGSRTQGFVNRLPFVQSTAGYTMTHTLDLAAPPVPQSTILPGSTWLFQGWFRDVPAGGAGFNFSNAVRVRFSL